MLVDTELDGADFVCVIKDAYGAFVYWNKTLHKWFPEPIGGMAGKTEYHIMDDADAAVVRHNDKQVLRTGQDLSAIEVIEMPNQKRIPWLVEKFRLRGKNANFLGVIGYPITSSEVGLAIEEAEELLRAVKAPYKKRLEEIARTYESRQK